MSAMLTLEEGGICQGELSCLRDLYRMGARMMTLTWNFPNELGFPNRQPDEDAALAKLLSRTHPGAVVLLHSTSSTNAKILDRLLTAWEDAGYRFGTLDELFGDGWVRFPT